MSLPNKQPNQPNHSRLPRSSGAHQRRLDVLARAIVSQSDDAAYSVSLDGIVLAWNGGAERLYGFTAAEMMGRRLFGIIPPDRRSEFDECLARVRQGSRVAELETIRTNREGRRLSISLSLFPIFDRDGEPAAAAIWARDMTRARETEAALRRSETLKAAILESSLDGIITMDHNGAIVEFNPAAERTFGWTREQAAGRAVGDLLIPQRLREAHFTGLRHYLDTGLGPVVGRRIEVPALRADGSEFPAELAIVALPTDTPVFAAYVRDITERVIADARLREAVNRENLLNRIGQAVRSSANPLEIRAIASATAGQALKADRCFFAIYDFVNKTARIEGDWRREDLASLNGEYSTDLNTDIYVLLAAGRTLVVEDIRTDPRFGSLAAAHTRRGLVSSIRVPIVDERQLVATMVISMAFEPRVWTAEEVRFVESVAAQARVALDAARNLIRQQRIATTLQDALQPPLPRRAPGLTIDTYYRAALEESSVGGDFIDSFPVGPEQTALVIGDLSGKGLQAAAQLASVRNMLRAMMAVVHPLSAAFQALNTTLVTQEALRGFVTLFAAIYDARTAVLTYASGGHEPILLYRSSTGAIEELHPTGTVLGLELGLDYEQQELSLLPGDVLILYTDGISEAGHDRRSMLGTAGLARIVRRRAARAEAYDLVRHIIDDVDAFAFSPLRDDACLLVAKVDGGPRGV